MGNLFAVFNFLSSFGRNTLDTILAFIPRNGCILGSFNQLIYAFTANALEIISFPSLIYVVISRRFQGVWISIFKKGANMFESAYRTFGFAYETIIFISGFFVYCFHDFIVILWVKGERARELNPLCRLSARAWGLGFSEHHKNNTICDVIIRMQFDCCIPASQLLASSRS